jgi:hypothetical protein
MHVSWEFRLKKLPIVDIGEHSVLAGTFFSGSLCVVSIMWFVASGILSYSHWIREDMATAIGTIKAGRCVLMLVITALVWPGKAERPVEDEEPGTICSFLIKTFGMWLVYTVMYEFVRYLCVPDGTSGGLRQQVLELGTMTCIICAHDVIEEDPIGWCAQCRIHVHDACGRGCARCRRWFCLSCQGSHGCHPMSSEAEDPLSEVVKKLAPGNNEVKPDVELVPGQIFFSDIGGKYHTVQSCQGLNALVFNNLRSLSLCKHCAKKQKKA